MLMLMEKEKLLREGKNLLMEEKKLLMEERLLLMNIDHNDLQVCTSAIEHALSEVMHV